MRLTVEPDVIALSPGDTADLLVRVANDGEEACTPFLAARGIDPDDVLLPSEVVAVGPGEVMTAIVRVRASADATPGDQRIAVAVEDLQGGQRPVSATTLLRVGARPDVAVQVEPVATTGRNRAKATTILRNRSDRRLQIDLEASGDGVAVRFRPGRIALDPGETRRVRTRIRRTRRSWFAEIRHGAVVTARGIGAPASTTLTFTQRPAIPRVAVRGLAAFMALTVWVAASVVVFQRLNAEDPAPTDSATAVGPATPGPGRTSATGLFEEPEPEGVSLPVVIQGTVEGPRDPSGTVVTAERISFGDEGTTTGLTKVAALTPVKLPRGAVLDKVEVTTDERGRFRIASGLVTEAFYRVTAVRAGFEVGSFIVSTSEETPEVTLAIALDPAPGVLAGRVVDAAGAAVGGASIVVTDGTLTYSTTTASEGLAAGTWRIEGVATPSTYQVIVTRLGFASQTLIVDVEGGRTVDDADVTLVADRGTLRGTVRAVDPATGLTAGVGGIDIALAGEEARTTRTITAPANLRGGFTFPSLPYGTYELTFSAPGWETRVAEVTVDRGDVVLNVSDLVRSTGVVQGHVWQVVTGPNTDVTDLTECRYPRISQRDAATTLARPCGGVSVSVTDDDGNVFATASATSTGFFQVDGVPAGEYSVRLSRGGYVDHIERVVLSPGGLVDLTPDHTVAAPDPVTLVLRPALSACLGTVELTVVQRTDLSPVVVGTANDPQSAVVSGPNPPAGVRIPASFDFECESGQSPPEWIRVDSNVYRVSNVPLGQTPVEVAFQGFQAESTILAVTAVDVAKATVRVAPEPRDIGGTVRVLSNGAGAERGDVRIRVLDQFGNPVTGKEVTVDVTTSVDLGSGVLVSEAEFTIPRVDVDEQYQLRIDGPGITPVTSSLFTLTAGGTPFDPGRQDVQALTTVSGTVRGFTTSGSTVVPADLSGATITFTPDGGSALTPETSAGDGTFSLELDAGPYDVTVAAPGYTTRTFSSVDLIGTAASPNQLLQPTTAPYAAYPTIVGTAGDVGLTPSARTVQIDVALDGATGATRAARVELVGGTIGGVATTTPSRTDTATITVDDATGTGRFTFASVPVGAYTLNVVPTDGAAEGITHTAATVVVGHDASAAQLDTTTTAQAMSRLTGRVVGFDVFTMALEPLSGATVSAPDATYRATTGADGSFSLLAPSGAYGTGAGQDFAAITVAPTGSAYETRTVTGTVSDLAGALPGVGSPGGLFLVYPGLSGGSSGDVGLSPAVRDVEVAVDLEGVDTSTQRDLVVRLVDGEVTLGATSESLTDVALAAASSSVVTAGTAETFSSNAVQPGTYELDVAVASGTRVVLDALASDDPTTARVRQGSGADVGKWFVDIQPGTSTIGLSATVQARTTITGTVHGFDANLAPTPLVGATLTLPAAARATTSGAVPAESPVTVTSDANGEFTVEVDAGDYSAGTITVIADGYAQRAFEPVLAAATGTLLTGAASPEDRAFVPNAGLAGVSAAAGDVVLVPLPRDVTVDLTLAGAAGASRSVAVALNGGTLGGAATTPAAVSATGSPLTLTVGSTATVTLEDVPVGAYTLSVAGTTADHVVALSPSVAIVPVAATPTTTLDLTTSPDPLEVQALTTLTVTVTGVQVDGSSEALTAGTAPLAGATVTPPVAGSPTPASAVTDGSGTATFVLRSGAYTAGDLGEIVVTGVGYASDAIASADATLVGPTASATLELAAAETAFDGSVTLQGASGATRSVTVEVCTTSDCTDSDDPLASISAIAAVEGMAVAFGPLGPLPVGLYWFRITGANVETTAVQRVIGPAGGAYTTTAVDMNATVTVSGTIVEVATTGDPVTAAPSRETDATLPLGGVTLTPTAAGIPVGGDPSTVTATDGTYTLELLSGTTVALGFSRGGFTLADQTVAVAAATTQTADFTMARSGGGVRIDGAISDNVTGVVANGTIDGSPFSVTAALSGAPGSRRYALEGLGTNVEWTIEFTATTGGGPATRVVRRFVNSASEIAIAMDQDAEDSDVGDLAVTVEIAEHPDGDAVTPGWVRLELQEVVPSQFYTVSPTGSTVVWVERTGVASGGVFTVSHTFSELLDAPSSPSIPEDRFTLVATLVTADGATTAWPDATSLYRASTWTPDGAAPSATIANLDPADTTPTLLFRTTPAAPAAPSLTVVPQAAASGQRIDVSWSAPANTGGVAAGDLSYVVGYRAGSAGAFTELTPTGAGVTSASITGLVKGTEYEVRVRAVNTVGAGPDSVAATARTAAEPAAPTGVTATPEGGRVTVTWVAPADDGGATVTGYTITSSPAAVTETVSSATTSVTFASGFAAEQAYAFSVVATNIVGDGPAGTSDSVTPVATVATIDPGVSSTYTGFTPEGGLTTTDGGADGGTYFVFDGVDDVLDLGTGLLTSNTSYTIIAWVHLTDTGSPRNILSNRSDPFWVDPALRARVGGAEAVVDSLTPFPTGSWQHVAFTFQDGNGSVGSATLYRGGSIVDGPEPVDAVRRYGAGQAYLGAYVSTDETPYNFWKGRMGQVQVWTGALTPTEVAEHFNATKSRYGVS